jgi:CubicO group peptidase (beta-lactamase class C family)
MIGAPLSMLPRSFLLPLFVLSASVLAAEPRDISAGLEPVRAKYHLPACAAAVVEKGKLRWEMPLSEVLPGATCDPGWQKVTLWDLVTQRSGLPGFSRKDWAALQSDATALSTQEQRAKFARALLAQPPAEPPGRFAYSNSGYGLLGAILEQATGLTYEELLRKYIFTPLDLKTGGFGPPATPGKVDQPWGHRRAEGDRFTPVDPTMGSPFLGVLAPAGCVHLRSRISRGMRGGFRRERHGW